MQLSYQINPFLDDFILVYVHVDTHPCFLKIQLLKSLKLCLYIGTETTTLRNIIGSLLRASGLGTPEDLTICVREDFTLE